MRILAACPTCHRQYDVSAFGAQGFVRCSCGTAVPIPRPRATVARVVRCASCGASRGAGGSNCEFCGARFSAVDAGWGSMCPGCFVRLPNDAQYCVECGLKIAPVPLNAPTTQQQCPRCRVAMNQRELAAVSFQECPACAGLWLSADDFAKVCKERETQALATQGLAKRGRMRFELSEDEKVKYVPCPVCAELMNRRNFAEISGVVIDLCKTHGVWLDNQELNKIIQFISDGGLERSREKQVDDAAHRQRMLAHTQRAGAYVGLPLESRETSVLEFLTVPRGRNIGNEILGDVAGALLGALCK